MRTAVTGVVAVTLLAAAGATAAATPPPTVTVLADQPVAQVHADSVGVNTPIFNGHLIDRGVPGLIRRAGLGELEFNGGGDIDLYHWRDGSMSPDPEKSQHQNDYSSIPPRFGFDQFERVARQSGATTMVHVNYGTGTAQEAAAWVRHANVVDHDGVRDWAIGEEVYLNGGLGDPSLNVEPDAHQDKSAAEYGRNVAAYAKAMKAVDPHIRIGLELAPPAPGSPFETWDKQALAAAGNAVDWVDVHWYPFGPQTDFYAAIRDIPSLITATRTLVGPNVRIVVGETNSAIETGTQQTSTDNAIYLADDELTLLENGVGTVDWWALHNGSADNNADLGLLSSGETLSPGQGPAPTDVPFAPYRGQVLTSALAQPGSRLVATEGATTPVVVHAARERNGDLVVLMLNEDKEAAHAITLRVAGYHPAASAQQRFLGGNGTKIVTGRVAATGTRPLPANSLTEITMTR